MKVVIEVYGGVADVTYKDAGVEVVIIDHDNRGIDGKSLCGKAVWEKDIAFKDTQEEEVM